MIQTLPSKQQYTDEINLLTVARYKLSFLPLADAEKFGFYQVFKIHIYDADLQLFTLSNSYTEVELLCFHSIPFLNLLSFTINLQCPITQCCQGTDQNLLIKYFFGYLFWEWHGISVMI